MRLPAWLRSRRVRVLAAAAAACAAIMISGGLAFARFNSTQSVGSNTFSTTTLAAPTGLGATGGQNIVLTWTATSSTFAAGYNVLRSTTSGSGYAQVAQVTGRTTVTYTDNPGGGLYFYVLQAYFQNWTSANSAEAHAGVTTTGLLNCGANAAVTASSGDNNGFEVNAGNACANDGASAQDVNSGTGTQTTCTDIHKDRHLYYNYGISVPTGSSVDGIEVQVDAFADATTGVPRYCVELSWDGGTTWTTAQTMASDLTTSEASYTLGSASDTWGRTWAVSDLSNANFRVRITSRSSDTTRDFSLEWAAVKVTYTPMAAPTNFVATGGSNVVLTWTASTSTFITGYNVLRSTTSGSGYSTIAQLSPSTTTYTDNASGGNYYYVIQSYYESWVSNTAEQAASVNTTGQLDCSANAAVTTSAGDNNGFEVNPGNACANDGAYAEDVDSGTSTSTNCTDSHKDKHLFYNYGISVPAGSTVDGIEVRLDGFADATTGAPRYCVELSWNGGTNWTAAKTMASDLTTSEATYTLGAANDTWNRTWAVADLSDSNFRVRISSRASDNARDFRLEWAAVRVTYTPP